MEIENEAVRRAFEKYLEIRKALYAGRDKPMTLMDIATIGTKAVSYTHLDVYKRQQQGLLYAHER